LRTLGLFLLALQVQGTGTPETTTAQQHDVLELVARSGPVSKAVLLVLILFSIASWAIILFKLWTLSRAERQSSAFLDVFRRSSKFSEVQAVCKTLAESPLVGIFQAGYAELNAQLRAAANPTGGTNPGSPAKPTLKSLTSVDRALLRAATVEINKLENRVTFLATTASITPYIGLFGTVWGIMAAFQGIGETGSTNLAVVAPGIADALIATAAGLFAAIPAVYFYNHVTVRVKLLATAMDDFALEFLNISERNFT
jgi:biopolymer transport protein TolQ